MRPLSGASDVDPIAAVLTGAVALCGECIARQVSAPLWRVHSDLAQLSKSLRIISEPGRCRDCEKQTVVHWLA
jgi:hypothetical protein